MRLSDPANRRAHAVLWRQLAGIRWLPALLRLLLPILFAASGLSPVFAQGPPRCDVGTSFAPTLQLSISRQWSTDNTWWFDGVSWGDWTCRVNGEIPPGMFRFDLEVLSSAARWLPVDAAVMRGPDTLTGTFTGDGRPSIATVRANEVQDSYWRVVTTWFDGRAWVTMGYTEAFMLQTGPPPPPTDVTAISTDDGIQVSWSPPRNPGGRTYDGYLVDRSIDEGDWVQVFEVASREREFWVDTDVGQGGSYRYRVRAYTGIDDSARRYARVTALVTEEMATPAIERAPPPKVAPLLAGERRTYTLRLNDGKGNDLVGSSDVCVALEVEDASGKPNFAVTGELLYDAPGCVAGDEVSEVEDQGAGTAFWVKVSTCDFANLPPGVPCEMNTAMFVLRAYEQGAGETLTLRLVGAIGGRRGDEDYAPQVRGVVSIPIIPREVTIRALAPEVLEGGDARFEVSVNATTSAPLEVEVALTGGEDFGVASTTRTVVIDAGATTTVFIVSTINDLRDEADGSLAAKIVPGAGYVSADPDAATVIIQDDDEVGMDFTAGVRFRDCNDCPEMVVIPRGAFLMGSLSTEPHHDSDEGPVHEVTIEHEFAVGLFEVTFDEWDACANAGGCTHNPEDESWGRGFRPVINVSWNDAKEYVAWLSRETGERYRLLTEAEWEYAARAGTTTVRSWGDDLGSGYANCVGCGSEWDGRNQTAPVGSFPANAFGLHDMLGNIFEWVGDCHHANYTNAPTDGSVWRNENGGNCGRYMLRGGSWHTNHRHVRSAHRGALGSHKSLFDLGFRVARTLKKPAEVTIRALAPEVFEGGEARFEVSVNATSSPRLHVEVALSVVGDFGLMQQTRTALIGAGVTSTVLIVSTTNDLQDEADGRLVAEIVPGTEYVSVGPGTVAVSLLDDDILVWVAASSTEVTEGDEVVLIVTAGEVPGEALAIDLDIAGGGDFGIEGGTRTVTIVAGATSTALSLATADDAVDDVAGTLTATVISGARHIASGVPVIVRLIDDDILVLLTPLSQTVTEGQPVKIEFIVRDTPAEALVVQVQLVGGGAFGIEDGSDTVTIGAGTTTAVLSLSTENDLVDEMNGTLMATVAMVTGYVSAQISSSTASVMLVDDDILVSLTPVSRTVAEGQTVEIEFMVRHAPAEALVVQVQLVGGGAFGIEDGSETVTIGAGTTTAMLSLSTENDVVDELDGTLTATVAMVSGYEPAQVSPSAVSVALVDDDILVSVAASFVEVVEGGEVVLIVTAGEVSDEALSINVSVVGGSDFGIEDGIQAVTIAVGVTSTTLMLTTINDVVDNKNSTLTAMVISGARHIASGAPATVLLLDDDILVSLRALSEEVREGRPVQIELAVRDAPDEALVVQVQFVGGGAFGIKDGSETVTIGAGTTTAMLLLSTENDLVDEVNGTLAATVAMVSGYGADQVSPSTASVTLVDDDILVLVTASSSTVTEGEDSRVLLTVTADEAPGEAVTVDVDVAGGGDFGIEDGARTVIIAGNATTTILSLDIDDDTVDDEDGTLTATVISGTRHIASSAPARVSLRDDDILVSITASSTEVTEGEPIDLTFKVRDAPAEALAVRVRIAGGGAFGIEDHTKTITIGAGTTIALLSLNTDDDEADDEASILTATIVGFVGYEENQVSPSTAQVSLQDNDLRVSLSAPVRFVEEGAEDTRVITVQLEHGTPEALVVRMRLTGGADYGIRDGERIVTVAPGETREVLSLEIDDDTVDDADTILTATVLNGTGYVYDKTSHLMRPLADGDIEVSIAASSDAVEEGIPVVFTVSASSPPPSALMVNVELTVNDGLPDGGNFGLANVSSRTVTINAGADGNTLILDTDDDRFDEPAGNMTATVLLGDDYMLGAISSATVIIRDNDLPLDVTIHAHTMEVTEGGAARFEVRANYAPTSPVSVEVGLFVVGGFERTPQPRTVVFAAGGATADLIVQVANDDRNELDGFLIAWIVSGAGYVPVAPHIATIAIRDNDTTMTVSSQVTSITEGESVVFTVRAAPAARSLRNVGVDIVTSRNVGIVGAAFRILPFEVGTPSKTFTVTTIDDAIAAGNGNLRVEIRNGAWTVGAPSPRAVKVLDNDEILVPKMVEVSGGTFTMGSPNGEAGRQPDESPQHTVTIAPFSVGRHEVTFKEWGACHAAGGCSRDPSDLRWAPGLPPVMYPSRCPRYPSRSGWRGGTRPVINVTWDDAKQYVEWLRGLTGEEYRLLTEAEWEYAARAGTTTAYHWGNTVGNGNANCDGCNGGWDGDQTAPVGSYAANAFGLHDMSGNVYEWVQDCFHESYGDTEGNVTAPQNGSAWGSVNGGNCSRRMLRGGSWHKEPKFARSANRGWCNSDYFSFDIGFRVAKTVRVVGDDVLPGISTSSLIADITDDKPLREVTIHALTPGVFEGEDARFEVRVNASSSVPYAVSVTLTDGEEFGVASTTRTVLIHANAMTVHLAVLTDDDDQGEAHGSLVARIVPGARHVPITPYTATVTILDDDVSPPDVNWDGSVGATDALILYYAYALWHILGTGR